MNYYFVTIHSSKTNPEQQIQFFTTLREAISYADARDQLGCMATVEIEVGNL